ncbi:MAG: HEAT repeat domain-containing protein [Desulfobacterales bacterium]
MAVLNVWLKQLRPVHAAFLIPGTIAAAAFAYCYLIASRGDCGVVRFYEYLIGIAGLALWFAGTGIGFILLAGKNAAGVGTAFVILTNSLMTISVLSMTYSWLDSNFYFTGTKQLMEKVDRNNDVLAALALGKRKEKKAVPLLCRIVVDESRDINLCFNAIRSLGEISLSLSKNHVHYETMMHCLTETLDRQRLRAESAKILGKIADKRAVPPLLDALGKEEDEFVKTDIIRALGMIKDRRACEPLAELLRENENSSYMLRSAIKEALTKIGEDREN